MQEILIIDDDRFLVDSISKLLGAQGFNIRRAFNSGEGYKLIAEDEPDLLILDLGLPDQDGVSLCRQLRARWKFPILMLTSRTHTIDKVIGLEVGADDYLTKPFDPQELLARVRAQLRRTSEYQPDKSETEPIKIGPLLIDLDAHVARVEGTKLDLTETEFKILVHLASNKGRALSREQLFDHTWGYDIEFSTNTLEVLIYRLRNKLERAGCPGCIHTLRGFGYKLEI